MPAPQNPAPFTRRALSIDVAGRSEHCVRPRVRSPAIGHRTARHTRLVYMAGVLNQNRAQPLVGSVKTEDVDLDWRAQQRGWICLFTPRAVGYHLRGGSGLSARPEIAACLLSNRFLTMIKNDDLVHIARDVWPIARRTMRDVAVCLLDNPRALPLAVLRVIRLLPRMVQKRKAVRRYRLVSPAYIRSMIR